LIDLESLVCLSQGISSFYYRIARSVFAIILISTPLHSDSSTISETKLKEFAEDASLQIEGVNFGGGVVGRQAIAVGRNLVFQYDVPEDWRPYEDAKDILISTLKESGQGDFYFKESIVVSYAYIKKNSAPTVITLKPQELSSVTLQLDDYVSINGHLKSKGINLRIRPPKGWTVEEGNSPNVVKKFVNKGRVFVIITKDAATFFSRSAYREMYSDEASIRDFAKSVNCAGGELVDYALVTVGMHPGIQLESKCPKEIIGKKYVIPQISWSIFYEDKTVLLMGMGSNNVEFGELKNLYSMVAATTSFPEQFN
jgi:hypothetical protein